jgi:hypothetical protein
MTKSDERVGLARRRRASVSAADAAYWPAFEIDPVLKSAPHGQAGAVYRLW